MSMVTTWRTPVCERLGIAHPIFGFSHAVDVVVEIARAGGYPVLGLAREMPHEIPEILREVDDRMQGRPYGVDLMLPSQVPPRGDIDGVRAALPQQHLDFVAGLRERFGVRPPKLRRSVPAVQFAATACGPAGSRPPSRANLAPESPLQ